MWRLNFSVFWLCLAMNNTYILYYICPLHTFFFLVVFFTMRVAESANHTQVCAAVRQAHDILLSGVAVGCSCQVVWPMRGALRCVGV